MSQILSELYINIGIEETRVARMENQQTVEIFTERNSDKRIVGNIYKGKIVKVLPGMQAAFLDIGLERTAFLYVKNIIGSEIVAPNEKEEVEANEEILTLSERTETSTSDTETPVPIEKKINNIPLPTKYKAIESLIKEGQDIIVQVTKEPIGSKGAQVSGHISIPGRFLVFLPGKTKIGISHRIENDEEKNRLKDFIKKSKINSGGFIVRTVAEGVSPKHLKDDMDYLVKQWTNIKKAADKQKKKGMIHSDLNLPAKILRDQVTENISRIVIDNPVIYKKLNKFIQNFLPKLKKKLELYQDKIPLFQNFGIEREMKRALSRKVWLKSGGSIVFDQTEALIAIDVNTGRYVGRGNLEETIFETNLEAAREIAYQIRLRNLAGIIIIDFIDMKKFEHKELIFNSFMKEVDKDPVKNNIFPISELGLIQMSRKRTQKSLSQQFMAPCSYCDSKGYHKSITTLAFEILRECEKEHLSSSSGDILAVYCHAKVLNYFTEEGHNALTQLEEKLKTKVSLKVDTNLHIEDYEIFSKEA